jgi:nicotinate-nucleotide adenylyltransferase
VNSARRIGVYGGTFDPIHEVHLAVARAALQQAALDEVLFVVSATPPHKRHAVHAEAEDRLAMVEAALKAENDPRMRASRMELERPGPSYTADTLRDLQALAPGAELFLIIGADALRDLPGWREPKAILERATLLAVPRPGFDPNEVHALEGRYQLLDFPPQSVSSTEIRARAASGAPLAGLLPATVIEIIHQRGLYRGADEAEA